VTAVEFTIPGDPVPKARPRFGKGRTFTERKTVAAEKRVGLEYLAAGGRRLTGPVEVICSFFRENERRVDVDNLTKLVLDGLNGIAFEDDSQVVLLVASKVVAPELPQTIVTVQKARERL
jgi:Holliday junction resolvase RusA-like endonuclease